MFRAVRSRHTMLYHLRASKPAPKVLAALTLLALAVPRASPEAPLETQERLDFDRGAAGLGLALRRVGNTARVLYVTAHPDDEHNGILVRLARGLGVRTGLMTVTRGEGGQNAIGPELFDALGVLRTGELLALHRYDGALQYFGRAYEFGYSFSVEETFARWGRAETVGDIVRVVRSFRPDVVLALPLVAEGGGQHHQAAAQLTHEAFRAAADPARYPEQGLRPWQARKLYEGGIGGFGGPKEAAVPVSTSRYDPLLGATWQELGARSRAMHRSQGALQIASDIGPTEGLFRLIDAEPAIAGAERDFLDGVDSSIAGLARLVPSSPELAARLAALDARCAAAREAFDGRDPDTAVAALASALAEVRAVRRELAAAAAGEAATAELDGRLSDEERDVEAALLLAHGVELRAQADDGLVTPGQTVGVEVAVLNHGARPVALESLQLEAPQGWTVAEPTRGPEPLQAGASRRFRFSVTVAAAARPTQPYWRKLPDRDRHELLAPELETLPWIPPPVVARARVRLAGGETAIGAPVVYRYEGRFVGGERRHALTVVPELTLGVDPEIAAVTLGGPRRAIEVRVSVRSYANDPAPAAVRLEAPRGFGVVPAGVTLSFGAAGEDKVARFQVTPPPGLPPGRHVLRAVAERKGREHRDQVVAVEHDHVERRQLLRPAEAVLLALDVRTRPGASVGYVMGSGDRIADAIERLGVPVARLTADDLLFSDLTRFSTIVTGIRAYETRADLRSAQERLRQWVESGGHLVVQYNRAAFNRRSPEAKAPPAGTPSPFAPYPAAVTSDRITDETAPVRLLVPDHPLFTTPNLIGEDDWAGWVQERSIQHLAAADPRYTELLAASDPFPDNAGEKRGLLVEARVGLGTWTYVGLVLFREVPAGVPGAWRLLANLVSRPGAAEQPRPAGRPGR
jgi:LmbE family N-acetylglucosaminyl deacetylase